MSRIEVKDALIVSITPYFLEKGGFVVSLLSRFTRALALRARFAQLLRHLSVSNPRPLSFMFYGKFYSCSLEGGAVFLCGETMFFPDPLL